MEKSRIIYMPWIQLDMQSDTTILWFYCGSSTPLHANNYFTNNEAFSIPLEGKLYLFFWRSKYQIDQPNKTHSSQIHPDPFLSEHNSTPTFFPSILISYRRFWCHDKPANASVYFLTYEKRLRELPLFSLEKTQMSVSVWREGAKRMEPDCAW